MFASPDRDFFFFFLEDRAWYTANLAGLSASYFSRIVWTESPSPVMGVNVSLISVCHELIRSAFHSTVESFREQRHTKTYIDFNLNKLKDEAYHIFLHSFDTEHAHLVDALRHVKGRDIPNPKNYAEAMQSEFQEFWNAAIAEEIANLKAYDVFRFEILPPGVKPINCRYVFKVKINQQGLVDRFKARLVVQGFRQRFGVDYLKTHASVCKLARVIVDMQL